MKFAAVAHWEGSDPRQALTPPMRNETRRAGDFAALALIGAMQCAAKVDVPADAAIVLATHGGNRRHTDALIRTVAIERTPPMPFEFIASQSGSACQLVARQFGVNAAALCLSSAVAPFEHALVYAEALLRSGETETAFIGWVEEIDTRGVSHWWCVDQRARATGATIEIRNEQDAARARAFIENTNVDVDNDTAAALQLQTGSDEPTMARQVAASVETRRFYRRVRSLGANRYLLLALTP